MKNIKLWEPIYIENSRIPIWLSKLAPIDIWAVNLAIIVFCRGELSEQVKRHEAIHYQQQLEMLFIGQWICYGICWLIGYAKYRDGAKAYQQNPFEQQAYDLDDLEDALALRRFWGWTKYKI
tara:strand:+ start:1721 stop:2086 length:366 start_codon:yes stop_codon:yes gene_type:complete